MVVPHRLLWLAGIGPTGSVSQLIAASSEIFYWASSVGAWSYAFIGGFGGPLVGRLRFLFLLRAADNITAVAQIFKSNLVYTTLYHTIGRTRDGEDSVTKTDETSATLRRKAKSNR